MPLIQSPRGFSIHYNDSGSGLPVLFIHGWCMASGVWKYQHEALSAYLRVISIDLNGHGGSGLPLNRDSGFRDYAADIEELVTFLGLEGFVAVGWSMGAQALISAYPALSGSLNGMVLVGATPRFTASDSFPHALSASETAGMRAKVKRSLERALHGFRRNILSELPPEDLKRPVLESLLDSLPLPSRESAIDGLDALMEEDVLEILQKIDSDVLIVHGSSDIICLSSASEFLQMNISGSRRFCYEGAGHAPFLTMPQRFNSDIISFARRLSDAD